jgi:hypothetical protein
MNLLASDKGIKQSDDEQAGLALWPVFSFRGLFAFEISYEMLMPADGI